MIIKKMKHFSFILIAVLFITYCDSSQGNTNILNTGDMIDYTIDTISFSMAHVTEKKFFPIGENDDDMAFVWNPYWIAETEVTYELWAAVYEWATHTDRGEQVYTLYNPGLRGALDGPNDTDQHPVTEISWRDVIVWCNALTEYCNYKNGTDLDCVYYTDSTYAMPLRVSNIDPISEANPIVQDLPFIKAKAEGNIDIFNCTAKGFRLPTSSEWELAARYRGPDMTNTVQSTIKGVDFSDPFDGIYWTRGVSLSGAPTAYDDVDEINNTFGVFNSEMAAVKSKASGFNALGLYDMSGNVREWCFDAYLNSIAYRMMGGGCYSNSAAVLQVGKLTQDSPTWMDNETGFRVARSQ